MASSPPHPQPACRCRAVFRIHAIDVQPIESPCFLRVVGQPACRGIRIHPAMSSTIGSYMIGGKLQQTVLPPSLVSSDYTWEEVRTLNGGVDLGLLDNKLTATFDIYRRDTKGMLTQGKSCPACWGDRAERERGRHEDDRMGTDRRLQGPVPAGGKALRLGCEVHVVGQSFLHHQV